jgi:uncharacterized protein (DUF3820 family)
MTFDEAKVWCMPFGKYAGRTLDQIAETDEGLSYLDWLRDQGWLRQGAKDALDAYLDDPAIAKELEEL